MKDFLLQHRLILGVIIVIALLSNSCKDNADPEPAPITSNPPDKDPNPTEPKPEPEPQPNPVEPYKGVPFYKFTPMLVTTSSSDNLLLEVAYPDLITSMPILKIGTQTYTLYDDATHGDKIKNDQIYTIFIPSAAISSLRPEDVYRKSLGFISISNGSILNIQAEVWNGEIPLENVSAVTDRIQKSSHLVNIHVDNPSPNNVSQYLNEFYQHFPDQYDFVNIIFDGFIANRYHSSIKNEVQGIGSSLFDFTQTFGSQGKLMGFNVYPNTRFFDGANVGYIHELGHQWINSLRFDLTSSGIPHWPFSDVAKGIMGFSGAGLQGSDFYYDLIPQGNDQWILKADNSPKKFNDLELYLMGLIPADEVGEHFVFNDQNQEPGNGNIFHGPITTFTINDIISANGDRIPSQQESQKSFRIATIIITDRLLNEHEMSFYNYFSKRAELHETVMVHEGAISYTANPFYLATGERGELLTTID